MKMLLLLVMMVLMIRVKADEHPNFIPSHQHYPGLGETEKNCTQNLGELLLLHQEVHMLRQEVHMSRQEEHFSRLLEVVAGISSTLTDLTHAINTKQQQQDTLNLECLPPWSVVGENCLMFAMGERLTWAESSQYCTVRGGRLATFHDANTFAEIIEFLNEINAEIQDVNAWVGGTDEEVEGVWRWVTGQLMPRGSPFWGPDANFINQPAGGVAENCAVLYPPGVYFLHDAGCAWKVSPLCQKSILL